MDEGQIGKDKRDEETEESKELITPYDDGRRGGRDVEERTERSKKKTKEERKF